MMMKDRNDLTPAPGMEVGGVPSATREEWDSTSTRQHPMFRHFLTALALLLSLLSVSHAANVSPPSAKPNIVFILADDLGLGDT